MSKMGPIVPASAGWTAGSALWRMGELLRSAIRHGALLDRRDWPAWIDGVQNRISICGSLIAVELTGRDGARHRRWIADPITALLILRWHEDRLTLPGPVDPLDCMGAIYSLNPAEAAEKLLAKSRASWRLRIPGMMMAYATGALLAPSVPTATWERLAYGRAIPDDPSPEPPSQPGEDGETKPPAWIRGGRDFIAEIRAIDAGKAEAGYELGRAAVKRGKKRGRDVLLQLPNQRTLFIRSFGRGAFMRRNTARVEFPKDMPTAR